MISRAVTYSFVQMSDMTISGWLRRKKRLSVSPRFFSSTSGDSTIRPRLKPMSMTRSGFNRSKVRWSDARHLSNISAARKPIWRFCTNTSEFWFGVTVPTSWSEQFIRIIVVIRLSMPYRTRSEKSFKFRSSIEARNCMKANCLATEKPLASVSMIA